MDRKLIGDVMGDSTGVESHLLLDLKIQRKLAIYHAMLIIIIELIIFYYNFVLLSWVAQRFPLSLQCHCILYSLDSREEDMYQIMLHPMWQYLVVL